MFQSAINARFYRVRLQLSGCVGGKYAIPLVSAFGCTPIHGKAVFGGALPSEIVKLIHSSDAMIGFTTRRDHAGHDSCNREQFTTHPWVVHELTVAVSQNPPIPFVEVRELGVISPGGIVEAANTQRIDYREEERADCLLGSANALEWFRSQTRVIAVRLGPDPVVDEIETLLEDPSFLCRCQILRGATELPPQPIPVLPIKGGLFVHLKGILEEDLVRITLSARGRTWRSSYESVDTVDIRLRG
jgi:hypothetical protein